MLHIGPGNAFPNRPFWDWEDNRRSGVARGGTGSTPTSPYQFRRDLKTALFQSSYSSP